jgi:hypothetical protein
MAKHIGRKLLRILLPFLALIGEAVQLAAAVLIAKVGARDLTIHIHLVSSTASNRG